MRARASVLLLGLFLQELVLYAGIPSRMLRPAQSATTGCTNRLEPYYHPNATLQGAFGV